MPCDAERTGQQQRHHQERVSEPDPAGRETPLLLARMAPVGGQIQQIVEQVNARGAEVEGNERERCPFQEIEVEEPVHRRQRQEHEAILDPVMRPQGVQIVSPPSAGFPQDLLHRRDLGHLVLEMRRRGHQQRAPRRATTPGNRRHGCRCNRSLCCPNSAIRRSRLRSPLKWTWPSLARISSNKPTSRSTSRANFSSAAVARITGRPRSFCSRKIGQHIGAVRQQMHVGHCGLGQPVLEIRGALEPPERQFEQTQRLRPRQHEYGFDQRIGPQQRCRPDRRPAARVSSARLSAAAAFSAACMAVRTPTSPTAALPFSREDDA